MMKYISYVDIVNFLLLTKRFETCFIDEWQREWITEQGRHKYLKGS